MDVAHPNALGERIREFRRRRRLSLETAAGLAGMSRSMLSYIERGDRTLERRTHIEGLAYALRVSPSELLGQPFEATDPARADAQAHVDAIRDALVGTEIGYADAEPGRPLAELIGRAERSRAALCMDADYTAASQSLANIITGLHAYTATGTEDEQRSALHALALACCTATATAKEQGYLDLAWIAAERARQATALLDDPALCGLAAVYVGYALESHRRSLATAERAIDLLQPHAGENELTLRVYGHLHLRAAYCNAIFGTADSVDAHLAEAAELAERLGDSTEDLGLFFGPTNLAIWRVTIAVEMGQGGRAVSDEAVARVSTMPTAWRRAMFHTDLGRAFAQDRRDSDALEAFLAAEELAPVYVRSHPMARSAVLDVRDRARRAAVGRGLSGLVYRMGLT
ncbi:MAG TPA: helix-turn-helix transcriptional regulator [Mycobacteriales bacterium]|jgi:Predicted transcriptional regulators